MEIIKADVLVIGGGGAGMRAAIAARENGADVLLVSKTPLGKSTCTYLSGGGFALAIEGLSRETHLEKTLQAGKEINDRKLAELLVQEAPERVQELERSGLVGKRREGRFNCLGRPPAWGASLARLLADITRKQGIFFVPWIMISELVITDGKVIGALGFDFRKGETIAFGVHAVILANGGGGALYHRHDNPVRTTGDGYALAFHAGCQLRDMEFVQFHPSGLAEGGKPPLLLGESLSETGRVINSRGEDIFAKYQIVERPAAIRSRDKYSLAIFQEEAEGRQVFIDLRAVSDEDWPKDILAGSLRNILRKTYSCAQKPLRISPMSHFFMGGVRVDQNGQTEISGLFAAGEVVGGTHGANRMGGNALSEVVVFGYRAGKAAAQWTQGFVWPKGIETLIQHRMKEFHKKIGTTTTALPAKNLRKSIGEILWEKAGILREEKGLIQALDSLQRLKAESFPAERVGKAKEILEKLEVENAFLVGEMIIRSALLRHESRGAHFRKDFPKMDDQNWKGNIYLRKGTAGMHLDFKRLP